MDPHGTEDTVRPQASGQATPPIAPRGEDLQRGASLGRYVVLEKVASGGMGTVYAAYDPQLDRRVALKVIRSRRGGAGSERAKARLRLEAQALARLTHPNVIAVHDVDEADGRVFVAMEFVEGQDLTAWLTTRRRWKEILEIFTSAARGLGAAHRAGLVHRDFKPQNVLLGADGRVRVVDFGIARRADEGADDEPLEAAARAALAEHATPNVPEVKTGNDLLGTPAYMAPEQARGALADARADQFSWCVSLFEALFGRRPFDRAVLSSTEPQAFRRPADLGQVPAWLLAVLERGLAWDPARRYPSMDALLEALGSHQDRKRRRWVLGALAGAVGCGALALWAGERDQRRQRCQDEAAQARSVWDQDRRSQLQSAFLASGSPRAGEAFESVARTFDAYFSGWAASTIDACVATRVRGVQTEVMYGLRHECLEARFDGAKALLEVMEHADRDMVERAPDAVRGLRRIGSCDHPAPRAPLEAGAQTADTALWADLRQGAALYHLGKNPEAIAALTPVAERADALPDLALTAESHYLLGLALAVAGEHKAARAHQHQAAIAAEGAGDDDLKARAWSALATVEGPLLGNVEEGERMSRYALAAASHLEHSPEVRAQVRIQLAQQAQLKGDWATALAQSKAAIEGLGPLAGDDDEQLITALGGEALALSKQGKFPEALALFQRGLAGCVKAVGERHPRCITTLMNLGNTLKKAGKIDEATVALRRVVELREQLSPGTAELGASYSNLAQTLEARHQLDEALAMYRSALAILEKTAGADHPNVAVVHANLCNVARAQGNWDEALSQCDRALEILLARVPKHPMIADLEALEADCQLGRGEFKKASELLDRSFAHCDGKTCTTQLEPSRDFSRARLTWASSHDRQTSLELATRARDGFAKADSHPEAEQVTAWLNQTGLELPAGK